METINSVVQLTAELRIGDNQSSATIKKTHYTDNYFTMKGDDTNIVI